jgi:hypothetical protein
MKTIDIYGEPLTAEEFFAQGFSGCEVIIGPDGNIIGRRYYQWWAKK